MKTATICLNGVEHQLCFSVRVVRDATEKFGSLNSLYAAMGGDNEAEALDATLWFLHAMMDAGRRYAEARGESFSVPEIPSLESMYDVYDVGDLVQIQKEIFTAVNAGSEREVEIEKGNAEATQGS